MSTAKICAIIPAKGRSRGIPGKNLRDVGGKPLILWTIEAALKSRGVERVIVSTDCREIAEIAEKAGAEVPFTRPAKLCQDEILTEPVVEHALDWLENNAAYVPDYVIALQPTSPLRTGQDIDNTVSLALEKNAESVVSVSEPLTHPYLVLKVDSGQINGYFVKRPERQLRRQDYPQAYCLNGAMFLMKTQFFREHRSLAAGNAYVYVMPKERSLDIDGELDLKLAEIILNSKLLGSS